MNCYAIYFLDSKYSHIYSSLEKAQDCLKRIESRYRKFQMGYNIERDKRFEIVEEIII